MRLTIDNFDGRGPVDYTDAVDSSQAAHITRKLNAGSEMQLGVAASGAAFVVPAAGARVRLVREDGTAVFTGYLAQAPEYEYLGWGQSGPVYGYELLAKSDEFALDRKTIPLRSPFVQKRAGEVLRELTSEMLPGGFDTSAVEDIETLPYFPCERQKSWSEHAASLGLQGRAAYRALDGKLVFTPIAKNTVTLNESDADFNPAGLTLNRLDCPVNDLTVVGRIEPSAYVKDYFVGDGLSLRFYLSQTPFVRSTRTLVEEEYKALDKTRWAVSDPANVVTVNGGKLEVEGGTGRDGETLVAFGEKVELGGAVILQHGDVSFEAASNGILGGLYQDAIALPNCVAGFRITPAGTESQIQAIVNAVATGPVLSTQAGHRYLCTTRLYAPEIYRRRQTFHSSVHPAGNGRGGETVAADARVVLEVHEIDPADPGSWTQASTVLYDGVLAGAPDYARYALVNADDVHCVIAFTRILSGVWAEVRSARPNETFRTRLVGSMADGAECSVSASAALQFYPQTAPAANEQIVVSYRASRRAIARVVDSASIARHANGSDDGVRGSVRNINLPAPRSSVDCENAALALLDDADNFANSGEYACWSDFLPGKCADIFPGDGLRVNVPSRGADLAAVVREVEIKMLDLAGEHSQYRITFADDAAGALGFDFITGEVKNSLAVEGVDVSATGKQVLADLTAACITAVTSTSVSVDCGSMVPAGYGVEVRRSDYGWGQENDRNLIGRFTTRTFDVPRLARVQDYYLRQYDSSSPVKYSRYTTALHLDWPL